MDVSREQFAAVAEGALSNLWVRTNPRPVATTDDIMEILDGAY